MPIKIKWESEITKIRKDLHTLQKENVNLREKLRGVTKESAKGAKGHQELARAAKRVYREIETPAQRYNRKMEELNRLLKAGAIDQQAYGQAAKRARRQADEAGRSTRRMFDLPGMRTAIGLLGGMGVTVSVAGAMQKIIGYARSAKEEIDGIVEGLKATHQGAKAIWQVAESKKAYESLSARVRLAMAKEGMTRDQAQDMIFNLKSLQQIEAAPTVARAARFMPADVAAEFVTTMRSPTTWGREAGTPEQVLSGLITGAGRSKFNVQETAQWAARVAPTLKAMGATPAEILGVGGAISVPAQKPEILGTYMFALEKQVSQHRRQLVEQGKLDPVKEQAGLIQGFRDLRADAEAWSTAMGEARFKRAAVALTGALEEAEKNTKAIADAFKSIEVFRQKVESLPRTLDIQQRMAVAEARKEVALEPKGFRKMQLDAAIETNKALAAMFDKSPVVEEATEDYLESLTTLGQVQKAREVAAERTLSMLRRERPDIYEQYIGAQVPIARTPSRAALYGRPVTMERPDLPGPPTQAIEEAMGRAMEVLVTEVVKQREATENRLQALRDVSSKVQRQPERTEVPRQVQRESSGSIQQSWWKQAIERPTALVPEPQIMREPRHPEMPGVPAPIQREASTQGADRLVEEMVRQRQATDEQLKVQREAVDATRAQTAATEAQTQALQQATADPAATLGLPPVPQTPAVITQPKDETAETAFSVN
jgi:hypothetical protein